MKRQEPLRTVFDPSRNGSEGFSSSAVVAFVEQDRCAGCGTCQDVCPAGAISVKMSRLINGYIQVYTDLVTEMHEIKHYYQKGVSARKGIESEKMGLKKQIGW